VSVVIPCYNHSQFLDAAIKSALAQTFPDLEVVVVDDGNEPDEEKAIASIVGRYDDSNVRLVRLEDNGGLAKARNLGIEAALGKWIVPLDADDIIKPTFIEATMKALRMDETRFAYTDSVLWWPDENREQELKAQDYDFTGMLSHITWPCTIMLAKSAWRLAGGYSEEMSRMGGWEDWDFAITLGEIGICGLRVPEPLFYYRQHSETQMRKTALAVKPRLQETLRRRHAAVYRGERTMSCCGGMKNTSNPTIEELQAAAAEMPATEDGKQIVRYIGYSSAPRQWVTPNDTVYEFCKFKPLISMPAVDAAYFQTKPDFEIVPT
jgi:glycosyltransferase involved in cell wall biosynthesis